VRATDGAGAEGGVPVLAAAGGRSPGSGGFGSGTGALGGLGVSPGVRETFTGAAGAAGAAADGGAGNSGSSISSAPAGAPDAGPSRILAARETSSAPRALRRASRACLALSPSDILAACAIEVSPAVAADASPKRNCLAKSLMPSSSGTAMSGTAGASYAGAAGAGAAAYEAAAASGSAWRASRVEASRCFGALAPATARARCGPPRWPCRPMTRSAMRTGGSPERGICGVSSVMDQKS
jgi:hypothetical protein